METDEANLQAAQVLKQDHILRTRLERVRSRMQTHIADVKREIDSLSEALTVEYTVLPRTEGFRMTMNNQRP